MTPTEMLKQCPPGELKELLWASQHSCAKSAQILCCGQLRCEECQAQHLCEAHSAIQRRLWWKFHTAPQLGPPEKGYVEKDLRYTRKKSGANKKPSPVAEQHQFEEFLETLSQSELQRLVNAIEAIY
jgi:hypothetical protein